MKYFSLMVLFCLVFLNNLTAKEKETIKTDYSKIDCLAKVYSPEIPFSTLDIAEYQNRIDLVSSLLAFVKKHAQNGNWIIVVFNKQINEKVIADFKIKVEEGNFERVKVFHTSIKEIMDIPITTYRTRDGQYRVEIGNNSFRPYPSEPPLWESELNKRKSPNQPNDSQK